MKRVYKNKRKEYPNRKILSGNLIKEEENLYLIKNIWRTLERKVYLGGSASFIVKRTLLKDIWFEENENIFEDYDFAFKILKKNKKNYYLDEKWVYINDYGESLSRRKKKIAELNLPKFFKNHTENRKIYNKLMDIFLLGGYLSLKKEERKNFIKKYEKEIKIVRLNKYKIYLKILIILDKYLQLFFINKLIKR